ncbi:hypothetical protein AVEN_10420-1 [Araneus ventricosus]|uniref:Uncharacterized protein n=1 Tax=Araneus ventricosus TaxID=182803 RepID=A0A4Y2UMI5_ARAVE|nr:hypothetical protein AVEN_10420-1 [Araneus ventricosus]
MASPFPNFPTTPAGGCVAPTHDLTCTSSIYTVDLQRNWVSNLEPSGPVAETLPLTHCDPELSGGSSIRAAVSTKMILKDCIFVLILIGLLFHFGSSMINENGK